MRSVFFHSTEDGEENANNTAYTYGCATEVKSGNNVVRYTYDGKRRVTAVELNGVENYVTLSPISCINLLIRILFT